MRTTLIGCALALIGTTDVSGQSQSAVDKASATSNSCLMMSDSMSTALDLSAEQMALVKDSDERCVRDCEGRGYRDTGRMDDEAIRTHDGDMKEILTTEQYVRWKAMCNTANAQVAHPSPRQF